MKRHDYHKIVGILFDAGHESLAHVVISAKLSRGEQAKLQHLRAQKKALVGRQDPAAKRRRKQLAEQIKSLVNKSKGI